MHCFTLHCKNSSFGRTILPPFSRLTHYLEKPFLSSFALWARIACRFTISSTFLVAASTYLLLELVRRLRPYKEAIGNEKEEEKVMEEKDTKRVRERRHSIILWHHHRREQRIYIYIIMSALASMRLFSKFSLAKHRLLALRLSDCLAYRKQDFPTEVFTLDMLFRCEKQALVNVRNIHKKHE